MTTKLFATSESWRGLAQRLLLAFVVFGHGGQKVFGWWGGYGFEGTAGWFAGLGVPLAVVVLIMLCETVGMIALAAGFMTRFVAAALSVIIAGSIVLFHGPYGFFMNWGGAPRPEGYEYHLLVLALSIPLIFTGAGKASLDGAIARRLRAA